MSREILEVTLRLNDGRVLTGHGRNVPATIERVYNQAMNPTPRARVTLVEHLKTGYVKKGEHRYQGTFHARFANRSGDPASPEELVVAEVREAKQTGG